MDTTRFLPTKVQSPLIHLMNSVRFFQDLPGADSAVRPPARASLVALQVITAEESSGEFLRTDGNSDG